MQEVKITNLMKLYTLLLLAESPRHGYEIIKKTEEKVGEKTSPGEIYPFLKLLKKYNYIKIKKIGTREKKVYYLTRKGRDFVKKMLNRFGDLIDIAVEPKLTICAHCGCKIYEGGHKEKVKGKQLIFCCHHCAKSYLKEM